jgi:hypothetical protein
VRAAAALRPLMTLDLPARTVGYVVCVCVCARVRVCVCVCVCVCVRVCVNVCVYEDMECVCAYGTGFTCMLRETCGLYVRVCTCARMMCRCILCVVHMHVVISSQRQHS